jgi:uncharacterized protein (TIGR04141 family)
MLSAALIKEPLWMIRTSSPQGAGSKSTKTFVTDVDAAFKNIPRYTKPLPIYEQAHIDEDGYNKAAVAGSKGPWCLMDKKLLHVGGVYDKAEFCDIYGGGELIRIKHYGSPSVLGHLFNQGLVSG